MKFRLLSLLILVTLPSLAGNTTSSMQKRKRKIANAQTLRDRIEKTNLNDDFIKAVKFIEIFADKEIDIDVLNKGLSTISDNMWDEIKTKAQKEIGTLGYYGMLPILIPEVKKELSIINPILLEILLKEDFPDMYLQLSGNK